MIGVSVSHHFIFLVWITRIHPTLIRFEPGIFNALKWCSILPWCWCRVSTSICSSSASSFSSTSSSSSSRRGRLCTADCAVCSPGCARRAHNAVDQVPRQRRRPFTVLEAKSCITVTVRCHPSTATPIRAASICVLEPSVRSIFRRIGFRWDRRWGVLCWMHEIFFCCFSSSCCRLLKVKLILKFI